ncbi:GNS1/SUR4 family protein [Metarhizium acridum CQMa 102]|uniref:Elongation of fatty acids protein n=1 Tax=Metarhizium acridum (strain CQMa 102) TaxID=655827 RepID=E9DZQ1_METAQ|nr:GNS1/SUR4 family protein [Metarhizium acridum CQMa 102]EFY90736.1 GNS1/SUR4 family protein [Metarhizium acridum CQMa 102]
MSAAQAYLMAAMPDASLFNFPPTNEPTPLSPAPVAVSFMRPFNIPDNIYQAALDPKVPLTIAALYAVTAKALNKFNASRNKKPWAMSQTRPFFAFVVFHNVLLAVYSAWTFWGMLSGMRRSIPSSTQMGRIWNEGLNYYGWIFYLSKFYEVLDTFIILAKGKFSSTLQTYHHAGAMLCMWAGMRYMSAPIWVFVLVNSFIHALMYTYYTLTAFSIRVPMVIKRTLTTMQITQFIVGATYAILHSFVTYVAPITVTKIATEAIELPAAPADAAMPTATGALDSLKKFIFGSAALDSVASGAVKESALITETSYVAQPCISTANETFAIWLNVLYLAPLTYLFVSFFIASYVKRSTANSKIPGKTNRRLSNVTLAEKAGWDAARGIEREVYGGENMVNGHANGHIEAIEEADEPASTKTNGRARRKA